MQDTKSLLRACVTYVVCQVLLALDLTAATHKFVLIMKFMTQEVYCTELHGILALQSF